MAITSADPPRVPSTNGVALNFAKTVDQIVNYGKQKQDDANVSFLQTNIKDAALRSRVIATELAQISNEPHLGQNLENFGIILSSSDAEQILAKTKNNEVVIRLIEEAMSNQVSRFLNLLNAAIRIKDSHPDSPIAVNDTKNDLSRVLTLKTNDGVDITLIIQPTASPRNLSTPKTHFTIKFNKPNSTSVQSIMETRVQEAERDVSGESCPTESEYPGFSNAFIRPNAYGWHTGSSVLDLTFTEKENNNRRDNLVLTLGISDQRYQGMNPLRTFLWKNSRYGENYNACYSEQNNPMELRNIKNASVVAKNLGLISANDLLKFD